MQHRLKKTVGVMGVATGEDETEIHPEFPQREAEYTAPTTSDHGKSSYGWHHGNKHLANAKGLRSGRALLRNPQLPCCQGEQISEWGCTPQTKHMKQHSRWATTRKALRGQRSWCCSGPGWGGNQGFLCTRLVTWGSTWKLRWRGNRLTHTHTPEAPFILKAQSEWWYFPTLLEKCWLVSDTVLKFDRQF